MKEKRRVPGQWWGEYRPDVGEMGFWRIGALSLWVQRQANEWRVFHASSDDSQATELEMRLPAEDFAPPAELEVRRFALRETQLPLRFKPVLPDRSVVAKPDDPFHVLAQSETDLFVSSPVWLAIDAGVPPRDLMELPLYRSSDTWFGRNTLDGELCYASRSSCRLRLEDLPARPQRVVTPVRIRNRSDTTLQIERLNLPVPYLSIHAARDGGLWTLPVTVVVEQEHGKAEIEIGKKVLGAVIGAKEIAPARLGEGRHLLSRALEALIG